MKRKTNIHITLTHKKRRKQMLGLDYTAPSAKFRLFLIDDLRRTNSYLDIKRLHFAVLEVVFLSQTII